MFKIYVLKSVNYKKSYVGFTDNLERRLAEHNTGKSSYTKRYKPWVIIYTEKYEDEMKAVQREKYLKSRSGRRYLTQIFKNL